MNRECKFCFIVKPIEDFWYLNISRILVCKGCFEFLIKDGLSQDKAEKTVKKITECFLPPKIFESK